MAKHSKNTQEQAQDQKTEEYGSFDKVVDGLLRVPPENIKKPRPKKNKGKSKKRKK